MCLLVLVASTLGCAVASGATLIDAEGQCVGANPYQAGDRLREECGVKTIPLVGITSRDDGGLEYHYGLDGTPTATLNEPPPTLNATKATAAEREAYGIPSEPDTGNVDAHERWEALMKTFHVIQPPDALYEIEATNNNANETWSGYVDTGSKGTFQSTGIVFNQPPTVGSCPGAETSMWTGLSGYPTAPLDQAGTAIGGRGIGEDQAWYEIAPDEGAIVLPLLATPGYKVEVKVVHGAGNEMHGSVINLHTGASEPFKQSSTEAFNGNSAEWIAERPTYENPSPLADFVQWDVIEAWSNGNRTFGPWHYTNEALDMHYGSTVLDATSGLSSQESGLEFYVNWHACI
jgi:Peptidase A4 family